jgi:hypothetical protein
MGERFLTLNRPKKRVWYWREIRLGPLDPSGILGRR